MKKFILIDDEPIFNFLTKKVIEKSGIDGNIELFSSPTKALESLKEIGERDEDCDLIILLDIRMPLMSGFEFIEELLKVPNKVIEKAKIFLLTSSCEEVDYQKAYLYPQVCGFFNKPFNNELIEKIKAVA
jgi:CheY-like chemotaxis protein